MSKGIDKESIMRPRIGQLGQVAPPMVVIGAQSSGRDVNDVGVMMSLRRFSKTAKSSMLHTSKRPQSTNPHLTIRVRQFRFAESLDIS